MISFPFDVVRTRLVAQNENHKVYFGILHAFKQMYLHEKPTVFFRGLLPTLIQVAPHAGIKFMMYNIIDSAYRNIAGIDTKTYSFGCSLVSGSLTGLCAKSAVYPLDLMRKRMQVQNFDHGRKSLGKTFTSNGLLDGLVLVFRNEGVRGWFKGLSPSLLKAVVTSAIHFSSYELICKMIVNVKNM